MKNSRTNKKLLAAVTVATTLAAGSAFAADVDVDVYGRANVSLDYLDNGDDNGLNLSSNSSFLGFRASTEIQPGLKGMAQVEQEIRFDQSGGSGSILASRDTFVGVEGGFGGLRAGYFDTPLKKIRSNVDLFGDQIGDMRNVTRLNNLGGGWDFDQRFRNGIEYYSPDFSGLRANVHYSTNNATGTTLDDVPGGTDDATAYSLGLTYKANDLYVALAHESHEALDDSNATRLGATYTMGALKLVGIYQMATLSAVGVDDIDVDTYGVGAAYKVGEKTTVKGQYLIVSPDVDDTDGSLLAVGVDYAMSKAFRLMAAYAMADSDDGFAWGMSGGGHGDNVGAVANGESTSGFSVGARYDF